MGLEERGDGKDDENLSSTFLSNPATNGDKDLPNDGSEASRLKYEEGEGFPAASVSISSAHSRDALGVFSENGGSAGVSSNEAGQMPIHSAASGPLLTASTVSEVPSSSATVELSPLPHPGNQSTPSRPGFVAPATALTPRARPGVASVLRTPLGEQAPAMVSPSPRKGAGVGRRGENGTSYKEDKRERSDCIGDGKDSIDGGSGGTGGDNGNCDGNGCGNSSGSGDSGDDDGKKDGQVMNAGTTSFSKLPVYRGKAGANRNAVELPALAASASASAPSEAGRNIVDSNICRRRKRPMLGVVEGTGPEKIKRRSLSGAKGISK